MSHSQKSRHRVCEQALPWLMDETMQRPKIQSGVRLNDCHHLRCICYNHRMTNLVTISVRHHYPFSALVGQEEMQLALLLNAIHPGIGGLLIRGEKGTAKSTAARALAALLPAMPQGSLQFELRTQEGVETIETSRSGETRPFIELPLGASDDRVAGTLDIEAALQHGQRRFEPGLLAAADGGILYVDEVNLLADHIVDLLLDVASSGINTVEREGISVSHLARFILIGTMNPEEGELRPQLLDRFGLTVDVRGPADPHIRSEVVRRRIRFENKPEQFANEFTTDENSLANDILRAQTLLDEVVMPDSMLDLITHICAASAVDGLRADITMYKTAMAITAWRERTKVTADDIRQAAQFVLPHRRRRQPFEEPGLDEQQLDEIIEQHQQVSPHRESNSSHSEHDLASEPVEDE